MKHRLASPILLGLSVLAAGPSWSETSVITVPVTAPLADVAAYVDTQIDNPIHQNTGRRICVEAERACTKIPEFRGFKIYSRMECIDVSPRISCDVSERIDREGPIRVTGKGNTLIVRQNLSGTVTAKGRGEIGKHLRQTVRGKAEFTVTATPVLAPDWTPVVDARVSHRWIDRPGFKLFNLIDISIGSHVDPALTRALNDARANDLPKALARLDLRGKAAELWTEMQEPIPVEAGDETLWLHVRPSAVGVARPTFDGGRMRSALSVSADLALRDTPDAGAPKTPLPDLTPVPEGGSRIVLPVTVGYDTINALLAAELPTTVDFDTPVTGSVEIRGARLSRDDEGLRIAVDIDGKVESGILRFLGGAEYEGTLDILAEPVFDPDAATVRLNLLRLSSDTAPQVAKILGWAVTTGPLGEWVGGKLSASFGSELNDLRADMNDALNREIAPGLRLEGAADLDIADLRAEDAGLVAVLRSRGDVRLVGFDPLGGK